MDAMTARNLRWFVGGSLVLGGLALAVGAFTMNPALPGDAWIYGLVAAAAAEMVIVALLEQGRAWPWWIPAVFPVSFLMIGVLWSRYEPAGHAFLGAFAPAVAFVTGLAFLAERSWSWPVAFASVTGFGPVLLLFVPLPSGAIGGAFLLFLVDAAFLLALAPKYFEPRPFRT